MSHPLVSKKKASILAAAVLAPLLAPAAAVAARTPPPPPPPNPVVPVQARTASSVLDIEGVNIHTASGQTMYANYTLLNSELAKLGVTHVRDYLAYNPNFARTDQYNEFNALKAQGIGVDAVLSPSTDQSDLAARVATIAQYFPGAAEAIEPPNEWNLTTDPNWAADISSYQQAMYAAIRSTPALDGTAVYGPALGKRQGYSSIAGLSSSLDYGNIHLYPGGRAPSFRIDSQLAQEPLVSGTKPVVVTEAGYHDDMDLTLTHPGTADSASASYTPELFLDYAVRNVPRVYDYELYDEACDPGMTNFQMHFGLIDCAGNEKPQFTALENFNQLLTDSGPSFTPAPLSFAVNAGGQAINQLLVQKSDGQYELFLWRDAQIWNYLNRTPMTAAPVTATVSFAQPVAAASVIDPTVSLSPLATYSGTQSIQVPLSGDAIAIQIG